MRPRFFLLAFFLALWIAAVARPPAGGQGSQHQRQPQAQSQQRQGQPQQQQRGGEMQQEQKQVRTRMHDCQQACLRAQDQSRQMQRYAGSENFRAATAQQLGRQLQEELAVMDREHARLRELLTAQEQERYRERLQTMDQTQQRWQENWQAMEQELEGAKPRPQELSRRARSIEKGVKSYRKDVDRLESALEP